MSHFSLGFACLLIGWALYPFWLNGIHQAYLGNGNLYPLSSYDPRGFFPLNYLWPVYFFSSPFLLLAGYFAVPGLTLSIPVLFSRNRDVQSALFAAAGVIALVVAWINTPASYFVWLAD